VEEIFKRMSVRSYEDTPVEDEKIENRTLDKLYNLYKDFIAKFYVQVKHMYKDFSEIKTTVEEIKKKKYPKNSTKEDKIIFAKKSIDELISLAKTHQVLDDIVASYPLFLEQIKIINRWNKYEQWIVWALDFGEGSYLATHIAKLTHSSSKGTSIDVRYFESCGKYNSHYICTSESPILDTAYPDNKYSSISQLYNIRVDGFYIGDLLRNNGGKYLEVFTDNKELLDLWVKTFSKYIKNESKSSYFLSKQTYFPTQDRQYHLLMPLTSSSLVHAFYLEHKKYWDEEQVYARKQKATNKFSATIVCSYPKKAYLHVTGSNHSNASSLNGERGGRIALLPAMPPQWKSRMPSYINRTSIFDKTLAVELKEEINELRNYLLLINNKSLSISEPKRNAAVMKKLRAISSQFFNYLETINLNEATKGWTLGSKLPYEEQLAFESWRQDQVAKTLKIDNAWQKTFSHSYGRWLNQQLLQKSKLKLTKIQAALWSDCFLLELGDMVATKEVTL